MTSPPPVLYLYGVVAPTLELGGSPDGLEDASLRLVTVGTVAALVSELDGKRYAPAAVEQNTEDVEWLAPRAVAHDRVLTWVSDRGPVVPMPMFSLFSGDESVRRMLRERATQLDAALRRAAAGREYTLRIYRIDTELAAVATELSPRLAELARAADAASPGQRYLLQRKLDGERKTELRAIGQRTARDVLGALTPHAVAAREDTAARRDASGSSAEPALVLDAAFLVSAGGFDAFRRELTTQASRHQGRGFRFDFTGPWPPYHFVQDAAEESVHGA